MNVKPEVIKKTAFYGALLILLAWSLKNIVPILAVAKWVIGLFSPLIIGLIIAFIINVPMTAIENGIFMKKDGKKRKGARFMSLVLTIVAFVAVILIVSFLVVPELGNSFKLLGESINPFLETVGNMVNDFIKENPDAAVVAEDINFEWSQIINKSVGFLQNWLSGIIKSSVTLMTNIFSGIISFLLACVFAVYILLQKEKLADGAKRIMRVCLGKDRSEKLLYVLRLTNKTFSSFLSGQCVEAVILGTLFAVTMTVLKFPYAMLIGVIVAVTALIPIVGTTVACVVGAFLILMISPVKAFWFVILFLVLQQIEGNLIYPRVVGNSIGLPSLFVLLAVTVGGSAFGIMGILLFIPIFSIIYTLVWKAVEKKEAEEAEALENCKK